MEKHLLYYLFVLCFVVGTAAQDCTTQATSCANMITQSGDFSKSCTALQQLTNCLNTIKDKCSSNPLYQSLKSSIDNLDSTCGFAMSSRAEARVGDSDPDDTGSCATDASKCFDTLGDLSDSSKICLNYQQFKSCWDPVKARCGDDQTFASIESQIAPAMDLCKNDGCGMSVVSECSEIGLTLNISAANWNFGFLSQLCQGTETFQQKCITKLESCPSLQEILKTSGVAIQGSIQMIQQIGKACVNLMPILSEQSSCLNSEAVGTKVQRCGEMLFQSNLSVDEKCQHLRNVGKCTETAVAPVCGKNVAEVVGSAVSDIIKINSENDEMKCPPNTASGPGSNHMMFGTIIAVVLFLI